MRLLAAHWGAGFDPGCVTRPGPGAELDQEHTSQCGAVAEQIRA